MTCSRVANNPRCQRLMGISKLLLELLDTLLIIELLRLKASFLRLEDSHTQDQLRIIALEGGHTLLKGFHLHHLLQAGASGSVGILVRWIENRLTS